MRDCSIQGARGAGESAALKGVGMGAAMSVGNSTSAVGALAEGAADEAVHNSSTTTT